MGVKNFQGNWTMVAEVLREVNRCHAAASHLPLDGVAINYCGLQAFQEVTHRGWKRILKAQGMKC